MGYGVGFGTWDDKNASYMTYYILEIDYVPVPGCTDPNANNYDETANVNDGICTYPNNGEYSLSFDGDDWVNCGMNSINFLEKRLFRF